MPSAAISSFSYDAARSELTIRFAGGAAYVYSLVPAAVAAELAAAPSQGAFVNQRIKDRYPFRKLAGAKSSIADGSASPSLKDRLGASLADDE
jgi:hypothetical protein